MAQTIELDAVTRTAKGKGAARQARRDGMVPGVVYGDNKDPITINVQHSVLLKRLKAGKFLSTLINLKVDGKAETVLCRGVQRNVVKDLPIHVDFQRLSPHSRIELEIPVEFINHEDCNGLKQGGVLTVVRNEVEMRVRADNIPEALVFDLAGLEINDVIRISDITLPEGATLVITDRDFMIANISPPSLMEVEEEVEEGAEGEAAEGEEAEGEEAEGEAEGGDEKDD